MNATNISQSEQTQPATERSWRQFLRFSLAVGITFVVEIDRVAELANIPCDRVVPIPHLPPAVTGVYNWRGEILWIVDLAVLLDIAVPLSSQRTLLPLVIIGDEAKNPQSRKTSAFDGQSTLTIGAIVSEIAEIEWIDPARILSPLPESLSSNLSSWVRGWVEASAGEIWLVLDDRSIFELAGLNAEL